MLTAAQVMTLKAKIKAELLRRSAHGSVAAYGGEDYDFTKNPEPEGVIEAEHGQKTVDLLLQIAPHAGLVPVEAEQTIQPEFDAELLSYVDTLAAQNMTGDSSRPVRRHVRGVPAPAAALARDARIPAPGLARDVPGLVLVPVIAVLVPVLAVVIAVPAAAGNVPITAAAVREAVLAPVPAAPEAALVLVPAVLVPAPGAARDVPEAVPGAAPEAV